MIIQDMFVYSENHMISSHYTLDIIMLRKRYLYTFYIK